GTTTPEMLTAYNKLFKTTGLNGGTIGKASLQFNTTTNEPVVELTFTPEGRDIFAQITKDNIGNYLGIFLDGRAVSVPVIRDQIVNGQAQISGSFTVDEAKTLVRNINYGALPIPISLISTETIGPSLGADAVKGGIEAGIVSFIIIA